MKTKGGVLPIHSTGLLIAGRDIGRFHLGYDVLVGNGIGSEPTADNDTQKSVTVAMHSQLTSALRFGVSGYRDRVSHGTINPAGDALATSVRQSMAGASVSYDGSSFELLGEYQQARNRTDDGSQFRVHAAYGYAGYRIGRVVPYLRADRLDTEAGDPYFTNEDVTVFVGGTRVDIAPTVVLKFEGESRKSAGLPAAHLLRAQVAIGFQERWRAHRASPSVGSVIVAAHVSCAGQHLRRCAPIQGDRGRVRAVSAVNTGRLWTKSSASKQTRS